MWGEDNDFNVQAMITRLMWTIWTSLSAVRERPLNLITHSLTLWGTFESDVTTDDRQLDNHRCNREPIFRCACLARVGEDQDRSPHNGNQATWIIIFILQKLGIHVGLIPARTMGRVRLAALSQRLILVLLPPATTIPATALLTHGATTVVSNNGEWHPDGNYWKH